MSASSSSTPPTTTAPSPGTKRSSRISSQRVVTRPILDSAQRAHLHAQRLAALEADNSVEDVTVDEAWEEEEEVQQGVAGKGKGKKGKGKGGGEGGGGGGGGGKRQVEGRKGGKAKKPRLTLEEIVDKLGMREEGAEAPNWVTATAGPCPHPPRSFCSVCGYRSSYVCVRCGQRYCCMACQRIHQDTRCAKFG